MSDFDLDPVLESDGLRLRPLAASDFDALHAAADDPAIWAGHPAKSRHEQREFRSYFEFLLRAGGTLIVSDTSTGKVIGCSRYYISPDEPQAISIGFTFLATAYWGGAWNLRMKRLMLDHAFTTYDEVWFHIAPDNIRSQRATAKLGAVFVDQQAVDLNGTSSPWHRYRLDKETWAARH